MNHVGTNFNDLLTDEGFELESVIVLRHCPWSKEPEKKPKWLWLVENKPKLFNEYQQTQDNEKLIGALLKKNTLYVAAFIGLDPGKAVFMGLYEIGKTCEMKIDNFQKKKKPIFEKMKLLGVGDYLTWFKKETVHLFVLSPDEGFNQDLKGKLVIGWPGMERSWWRRAHSTKSVFRILEVKKESAFA